MGYGSLGSGHGDDRGFGLGLRAIADLLQDCRSLMVARPCPLCQRPAPQHFCYDCQRQLAACQLAQPDGEWLPNSTASAPMLSPGSALASSPRLPPEPSPALSSESLACFAWGRYGEPVRRAIAALKYQGQPHLARPLGHGVGAAWQRCRPVGVGRGNPVPLVVPIPLHPRKLQQRGFNQAALLAQYFCQMTRLPYGGEALRRVKATAALFGLDAQGRSAQMVDAFAPDARLLRRWPQSRRSRPPILLFDDIYTTGTTARSAAQCLQAQGFQVLGIVVLARAGRSAPPDPVPESPSR